MDLKRLLTVFARELKESIVQMVDSLVCEKCDNGSQDRVGQLSQSVVSGLQ